jgi:hypothetical protein
MNQIIGKTYSLFDNAATSDEYFQTIKKLTDFHLEKFILSQGELLKLIRLSEKKGNSKRREKGSSILNVLQDNFYNVLSKYTLDAKKYLRKLSLLQRFDKTLRTKEFQYHLYMVEVELVNRINTEKFKNAGFKMALLPHCLRDFYPGCMSTAGDIEHICQGCREKCHINLGSTLLREHEIEPLISVTMDQRKLLKTLKTQHLSIGVLGIACIPELARGMRLCQSLNIPAIGIPLDANRCARWMGKAYKTSFNLKELKKLII